MIHIVNWLLTRKCNLNCEYCAIVKNYKSMPDEYPKMSHYIRNEMSLEYVIKGLERFKMHNPDCFHIFYGGEPLLRKDLPEIINYCNKENIHYTIISNNTNEIRPLIENLFLKVDRIKGFTASVDPVFNEKQTDDRIIKSIAGFENLVSLKDRVDDVVAEITVMKHNVKYLYSLVEQLTEYGISSDITFIDIAKSPYYDFSDITDHKLLVEKNSELIDLLLKLQTSNLDIHMKDSLLSMIWEILPSDLDCGLEKSVHNVTVDADGSIRLCLRIRGYYTPKSVTIPNLIKPNGEISYIASKAIKKDKTEYCLGCNHTCLLMSMNIENYHASSDDLIHKDRRL